MLGWLFGGNDARCDEDLPHERIRLHQLYTHQGDYTRVDVLEQVGIRHASAVILLTDRLVPRSEQDRDARTVLAALTIERLAPHIFTVAELNNRENASLLELAGVEEIVVGDWYAGVIMGSASRNPGLISVLDEVLTTEHGNAFHTVAVPDRLAGTSVRELHRILLEEHEATLVSLERGGRVRVNPAATMQLEEEDRLVVLSRRPIRW